MKSALNDFHLYYNTCLRSCNIFDKPQGDTDPAIETVKRGNNKEELLLGRGVEEEKQLKHFKDQQRARKPLPILGGGSFKLFIKCSATGNQKHADIVSYTLRFVDLKTKNGIHCFRYDKDLGVPRGRPDWDEELEDAPSHPAHHLHINFVKPKEGQYEPDNDLRLPTGDVDPVMILRSVDYWYSRVLGLY